MTDLQKRLEAKGYDDLIPVILKLASALEEYSKVEVAINYKFKFMTEAEYTHNKQIVTWAHDALKELEEWVGE